VRYLDEAGATGEVDLLLGEVDLLLTARAIEVVELEIVHQRP
jgi:hypothetical protein